MRGTLCQHRPTHCWPRTEPGLEQSPACCTLSGMYSHAGLIIPFISWRSHNGRTHLHAVTGRVWHDKTKPQKPTHRARGQRVLCLWQLAPLHINLKQWQRHLNVGNLRRSCFPSRHYAPCVYSHSIWWNSPSEGRLAREPSPPAAHPLVVKSKWWWWYGGDGELLAL